jgi:hypothetical protein
MFCHKHLAVGKAILGLRAANTAGFWDIAMIGLSFNTMIEALEGRLTRWKAAA